MIKPVVRQVVETEVLTNQSGQIVKQISNTYTVKYKNNLYDCSARGKLKFNHDIIFVGDYCNFDLKQKIITQILPRKNCLYRPNIANVDTCIVVTSLKQPSLSLYILDKFLINLELNKINPIICLTKKDLLNSKEKKEIKKIFKDYKKIGYQVIFNTNIFKLKYLIRNKLVVLAGASGSGKSTLLNRLCPQLDIKTNQISIALNRGKNTTTHVEFYQIGSSFIADTPGFTSLDLIDIKKEELQNYYPEFRNVCCKYSDCKHIKEQGCLIKEKVAKKMICKNRYDNYLKIIEECK